MASFAIATRPEGCTVSRTEPVRPVAPPQTWCGGSALGPLETGLRAVSLSPSRAGLAGAAALHVFGSPRFADMLRSPSAFAVR